MSESDLNVNADLSSRFSQLGEIKEVADRLRARLDQISQDNLSAAGTDDEYAQQYHANVDEPTRSLSGLVDGIGGLFGTTGANGQTVAGTFADVDDDSSAAVKHLS